MRDAPLWHQDQHQRAERRDQRAESGEKRADNYRLHVRDGLPVHIVLGEVVVEALVVDGVLDLSVCVYVYVCVFVCKCMCACLCMCV
jgi:hypothetical protein